MAALQRRLRQQEIVAAFGVAALRGADRRELMHAAAGAASEGLQAGFSKVLEHLPERGTLLVRAGVGWRPGVVGIYEAPSSPENAAGYALHHRVPVVSNAAPGETRFCVPDLMVEHGIRRAINVPIPGDRPDAPPIGVLEADSRDPGAFSEDDTAFLSALANVLAVALGREAVTCPRSGIHGL